MRPKIDQILSPEGRYEPTPMRLKGLPEPREQFHAGRAKPGVDARSARDESIDARVSHSKSRPSKQKGRPNGARSKR